MRSKNEQKILIPVVLAIAVLIFDGDTAIAGARSGLDICIKTVIPSLFPFIFLSSILSTTLLSLDYKKSDFLCKQFGIPYGTEGILVSGLLGGYPVGAKCIGEAVNEGRLSSYAASKMLVFCNAAGPSFIFGIISVVFLEKWVPWLLWGIHLLSAFFVAKLLHPHSINSTTQNNTKTTSITQRLRKSIQAMSEICGWIILMRTVIAIIQKWCLWRLAKPLQILITGILELSNGCISLSEIHNDGLRFLLSTIFLSFGGICVTMQTASATPGVSHRLYIPGKCIQALISFSLAYILQFLVFQESQIIHLPWLFVGSLAIILYAVTISGRRNKKVVEIYNTLVYNGHINF